MPLVDERQDSKEGKHASKRQNTPMPGNGWHRPGKTTRQRQSELRISPVMRSNSGVFFFFGSD
jgi:hypothetical protein